MGRVRKKVIQWDGDGRLRNLLRSVKEEDLTLVPEVHTYNNILDSNPYKSQIVWMSDNA